MNVIITVEEEFKRQAKKLAKEYHSISDDLLELQELLKANPLQGVSLGSGVRHTFITKTPRWRLPTSLDKAATVYR